MVKMAGLVKMAGYNVIRELSQLHAFLPTLL